MNKLNYKKDRKTYSHITGAVTSGSKFEGAAWIVCKVIVTSFFSGIPKSNMEYRLA